MAMKMIRYSAKTEFDAMQQIKANHGSDCYILQTKMVKAEGIFGFLKKPTVEILVGIEDEKTKESNAANAKEIDKLLKENDSTKRELEEIKKTLAEIASGLKEQEKREVPKDAVSDILKHAEIDKIVDEEVVVEHKPVQKPGVYDRVSGRDKPIYQRIIKKGVCDKIALDLIEQLVSQNTEVDLDDAKVKNKLKIAVKDMLGFPYKIKTDEKKRKIFFFIGPTGVGKTTTIAKIAAKLSLLEGKDVVLVTCDTFRIAAVDQLKTYSTILNVPLNVVYKPIELEEALIKYQNSDYILIDTAGRNHKDREMREHLEEFLKVVPESEIFLLVSLTTSELDIQNIVESYSFLDDYKLIFTKIDESVSPGNILNLKALTGKSMSFITNGQSVPDDIMAADPELIADMIVGD